MRSVLEVCVDSTASALAAKRGGASRLELCADLIVGGTTPSLALVRQVKAETGLPVRALLRPRFGDFCYDSYELAQMEQLAAELVEAGADGIVTGVLTPEGQLNAEAMRPIYAAARRAAEKAGRPVACTLHRAFDVSGRPLCGTGNGPEHGPLYHPHQRAGGECPRGSGASRPTGGAGRGQRGNSGRCRCHGTKHPGTGRTDRGTCVPPFWQAGAAKPHDLPPRGCAHGAAGLFRV